MLEGDSSSAVYCINNNKQFYSTRLLGVPPGCLTPGENLVGSSLSNEILGEEQGLASLVTKDGHFCTMLSRHSPCRVAPLT